MDEKTKEKLAEIVGHDEDGESLRKEVSIIKDGKQFSVRIPKKFAEIINIDVEKDTFEFILKPKHNEDGTAKGFDLIADLKKG